VTLNVIVVNGFDGKIVVHPIPEFVRSLVHGLVVDPQLHVRTQRGAVGLLAYVCLDCRFAEFGVVGFDVDGVATDNVFTGRYVSAYRATACRYGDKQGNDESE